MFHKTGDFQCPSGVPANPLHVRRVESTIASPLTYFIRPEFHSRKLKTMAYSSRTLLQKISDSQGGYRSLAGYVFQLLGSATEAVELVRIKQDANFIDGLITLEQYGQDSFVCLIPGTEQSRFTQYKHSLTGDEIQPAELREVLYRFVASAELADRRIEHCEFILATNRGPSDWTKLLLVIQEKYGKDRSPENLAALEEQLWKGCSADRPACKDKMLEIFKVLKWQSIDEESMKKIIASRAYDLGVPRRDLDKQIQRTMGLFLGRANSKVYRSVSRQELDDELAGHQDARPLRSEQSRTDQRQFIENALVRIHHNQSIARRGVVTDIAAASLAFPLVLVIGDGGRGKSLSAWQSLLEHLRYEDRAPDFATGRCFGDFSEVALVNEFARWRNQGPNRDSATIGYALEKLSAGCPHTNLLVLYVDGIDEKQGQVKPYFDNQYFIERLLQDILQKRSDNQHKQISLIVSCRTIREADWLTRIVSKENYTLIRVDEFSDSELEELAITLFEPAKMMMLSLVSKDQQSIRRFSMDADQQLIRPLREPRVWASFVELDLDSQVAYLSNFHEGKRQLAAKYLQRIEEKAAERLAMNLGLNELETILREASRVALENDSEVCRQSQWLEVCDRVKFGPIQARNLFDELVTAGLFKIESENGKTWSWNQLWLRDALCNREVIQ